MKNMIETKNLTKTYKEFIAVDHVSLHIKKGSIYGFLGPNGAGKSTTMKMLLGLTAPTDGEFQIDNMTFPKPVINSIVLLKQLYVIERLTSIERYVVQRKKKCHSPKLWTTS